MSAAEGGRLLRTIASGRSASRRPETLARHRDTKAFAALGCVTLVGAAAASMAWAVTMGERRGRVASVWSPVSLSACVQGFDFERCDPQGMCESSNNTLWGMNAERAHASIWSHRTFITATFGVHSHFHSEALQSLSTYGKNSPNATGQTPIRVVGGDVVGSLQHAPSIWRTRVEGRRGESRQDACDCA